MTEPVKRAAQSAATTQKTSTPKTSDKAKQNTSAEQSSQRGQNTIFSIPPSVFLKAGPLTIGGIAAAAEGTKMLALIGSVVTQYPGKSILETFDIASDEIDKFFYGGLKKAFGE